MITLFFQLPKNEDLQVLVPFMDSTEDKINQAVLQFTLGEEKEAQAQLQSILHAHPDSVEAWRALAEVCLSLKDLDEAERACRQAMELSPDDLTLTVSLARILVNKGDKEGAEDASAKARILGWKEELAQDE